MRAVLIAAVAAAANVKLEIGPACSVSACTRFSTVNWAQFPGPSVPRRALETCCSCSDQTTRIVEKSPVAPFCYIFAETDVSPFVVERATPPLQTANLGCSPRLFPTIKSWPFYLAALFNRPYFPLPLPCSPNNPTSMALNFMLPLRIAQALFAIIALGLSAYGKFFPIHSPENVFPTPSQQH